MLRSVSAEELRRPRRAQGTVRIVLLVGLQGLQLYAGDIPAAHATAELMPAAAGIQSPLEQIVGGAWEQWLQSAETQLSDGRYQGNRLHQLMLADGIRWPGSVLGRRAVARQALRSALQLSTGACVAFELRARAWLAILAIEDGELDEARTQVAACRALEASADDLRGLAGRVRLAEATLAAADGRSEDSTALFEASIGTFRRYGVPWHEAEAEETWAQALCRADDEAGAQAHFDAAADIYRRMGAGAPWIERVERLRGT